MSVLFALIEEAERLNEKMVIFSHSLKPLRKLFLSLSLSLSLFLFLFLFLFLLTREPIGYINKQLTRKCKRRMDAKKKMASWLMHVGGQRDMQSKVDRFNAADPTTLNLFLISTKVTSILLPLSFLR